MKKILSIVGARPQFIKAFVTIKSLNKMKLHNNILLHTGQHFDHDMSEIFFKELKFNQKLIKISLRNQNNRMLRLSEMLYKINNTINKIKPNIIIIYGDTDSTLVGAIIARRLNIKLIHIEAGLRSNIIDMPEEQNRVFSDYLSDYLICPNHHALKNLRNYKDKKIYNFGDVMYDSFNFYRKYIDIKYSKKFKKKYKLPDKYIFFTIHRDANSTKLQIKKILGDISKIEKTFFWPIHPKIKLIIKKNKIKIPKNIIYCKPLSYLESLAAIKESIYVITDSGGIQKETYFYRKKCFVLRKETEWSELIKVNCVKLISNNILTIEKSSKFLNSRLIIKQIFGNGNSTLKIAKLIKKIIKI